MASVSKNKRTGDVTIQFTGFDGKRKTLRLGKPRQRTVETFKSHLEELLEARAFGRAAYDETIAWSNRLYEKAPQLYGKLANHELVPNRAAPKQMALAVFLDNYIAKQKDKKRSTIVCLTQCRNDLVEFLGADRALADITEGDAEAGVEHIEDSPGIALDEAESLAPAYADLQQVIDSWPYLADAIRAKILSLAGRSTPRGETVLAVP